MSDDVCAICLEELTDVILNCNHIYHKKCIGLLNKKECPLCRGEITSPEEIVDMIQQNIDIQEDVEEERYDVGSPLSLLMSVINYDPNSIRVIYLNYFFSIILHIYEFIATNSSELHIGDETITNQISYHLPIHFSTSFERAHNIIIDTIFACHPDNGYEWSNDIDVIRTYSIYSNGVLVQEEEYTIRQLMENYSTAIFDVEMINEGVD